MATFDEMREPTSRKYVAEEGIVMSNRSKTFQTFWSHSSVFPIEKLRENLNSRVTLRLIDPLVATSNQSAPSSRIKEAEEAIEMPN